MVKTTWETGEDTVVAGVGAEAAGSTSNLFAPHGPELPSSPCRRDRSGEQPWCLCACLDPCLDVSHLVDLGFFGDFVLGVGLRSCVPWWLTLEIRAMHEGGIVGAAAAPEGEGEKARRWSTHGGIIGAAAAPEGEGEKARRWST
jgi:hypothetical protein